MSSTDVVQDVPDLRSSRRFAVTWRHTILNRIIAVGTLDHDSIGYRFQYLDSVRGQADFRPFLGFPEFERVYESPRLWPFFDVRVMHPKRPDYSEYIARLGLTDDASRLDVLSRSGGERKGDAVYLAEEPSVDSDGRTSATFLVRGSRYATGQFGSEVDVDRLEPGDLLQLQPDPENPANPLAVLLATSEGRPIGWVPDVLIPYTRSLTADGRVTVTIVRNNGPDAPWHIRLLVTLSGYAEPGTLAFSGGGWPPRRSLSATPDR